MSTSLTRYARLLKLLSHPARLEIIHLLRYQSLFVQDIELMIGRPQAFISQQLQQLRDAGIVVTERVGRRIAYKLENAAIIRGSDMLRKALGFGEKNISRVPKVFRDPVCGMTLEPKSASFRFVYRSQPRYFCASGCMKRFQKSPSQYL